VALFMRFALSGLVNYLFSVSIFYLVWNLFRDQIEYHLIALVSATISILFSNMIHIKFTFRSKLKLYDISVSYVFFHLTQFFAMVLVVPFLANRLTIEILWIQVLWITLTSLIGLLILLRHRGIRTKYRSALTP